MKTTNLYILLLPLILLISCKKNDAEPAGKLESYSEINITGALERKLTGEAKFNFSQFDDTWTFNIELVPNLYDPLNFEFDLIIGNKPEDQKQPKPGKYKIGDPFDFLKGGDVYYAGLSLADLDFSYGSQDGFLILDKSTKNEVEGSFEFTTDSFDPYGAVLVSGNFKAVKF